METVKQMALKNKLKKEQNMKGKALLLTEPKIAQGRRLKLRDETKKCRLNMYECSFSCNVK